jgi:CubicO group peptidase (beta-lactamase class C family)
MSKYGKRNICFFIILLLSIQFISFAQNKEILKKFKGFDEYVQKTMKDWKTPGLGIAIVKDGEIIYSSGYGYRDVKNKLPVTVNTFFPIASCSKAFTTTALGILAGEGKLDWDKPARTYLPALKLSDDYITENITPRDMVTHRSGLSRHDGVWWRAPFTRKELFERLRYLEFSKGLRQSYQYNNLMFMTAGMIVEGITDTTWENFVRKRILDPLEMKETNFSINILQKMPDHALPYLEVEGEVRDYSYCNMDALGPAGSINSNTQEMAKWIMMNLNKGRYKDKQIISEAKLKEIQSPQIVSSSSITYEELFYSTYGMGWGINSYRGKLMLNHWGGIDGFAILVSMLPKENIGMITFVNLEYSPLPGIIAYNVYDRMLGLKEIDWNKRNLDRVAKEKEKSDKEKLLPDTTQKTGTKPSHLLEDYTGFYENPAYGILTVVKMADKLQITYNGIPTLLKHYHYDVFQAEDPVFFEKNKYSFVMDKKGDINRITVPLEASVKDIVFTKITGSKK